MAMTTREARDFGAIEARVDSLTDRLDKLDARRFTTAQTWLMIGAIVGTGVLSTGGAVLVQMFA